MAKSLKELVEEGIVFPALLPTRNSFLFNHGGLGKVTSLDGRSDQERIQEAEKFHKQPISEKIKFVDLDKLNSVQGYTINLMGHDYDGRASSMWNYLYSEINYVRPISNGCI